MKASELRIGNYFNEVTQFCTIQKRIQPYHLVEMFQCEIAMVENPYSPVTLTEEWLSKLGFYRFNPENYPNRWTFKDAQADYTIYIYPKTITICIDDSNYGREIPYVHILQNVWYALEDKELILNPAQ